MADTTLFIRPIDVLFFRGNRLFGSAGSFGMSNMPPQPSVAAGALRSALLTHRGVDLNRFAKGELADEDLGTPDAPGSFALLDWQLARKSAQGIEPLYRPPADLVIKRNQQALYIEQIQPAPPPTGIQTSAVTKHLAILPEQQRGKPESGYWLTQAGWQAYLDGATPKAEQLIASSTLWQTQARTGIGLNAHQRSVEEGKLFSTEAICLTQHKDQQTGFIARVSSTNWPQTLNLRLGGDGRGALAEKTALDEPKSNLAAIAKQGKARLVLTTPGLFKQGWTPGDERGELTAPGVRARISCAAVPRAETISGFDVARHQPKPAQRVAPAGSVYWLDEIEADPEALQAWLDSGLWHHQENPTRKAEGYNRFALCQV